MKKVTGKNIEWLTSKQALDLCKDQGYPVVNATIHIWFYKYGLGKKVAGRLRYDKEKLLQVLAGDGINEKNTKVRK